MQTTSTLSRPWLAGLFFAFLLSAPAAYGQISVVTTAATAITTTGATLNGTVNGNGEDIAATFFDFGPTVPYAQVFLNAIPFNVTAAQGQTAVSLAVGGLTCASTYHFRVTADDSNGRNAKGSDMTLTTAACPAPKPSVPVPTLSDWALVCLAALVGVVAWRRRRARRNA